MKLLRTNNWFYVCEFRSVVFVTWVAESDRDNAAKIPNETADEVQSYVFNETGVDTEIVNV